MASRGANVSVSDFCAPTGFDAERAALRGFDVRYSFGEHKLDDFTGADFIVVSPGVPLSIPPLDAARDAGVKIIPRNASPTSLHIE